MEMNDTKNHLTAYFNIYEMFPEGYEPDSDEISYMRKKLSEELINTYAKLCKDMTFSFECDSCKRKVTSGGVKFCKKHT